MPIGQFGEDRLTSLIGDLAQSNPPDILVPIGDDAAVLAPPPPCNRPVLTADAFAEGTHFVLSEQVAPEFLNLVGREALQRGILGGMARANGSFDQGAGCHESPLEDLLAIDWSDSWEMAIGHRLAMANLSDLAAMGAAPGCLTLTIAAAPAHSARTLALIALGAACAGTAAGAPLVGGDTIASRPGAPLILSLQATGWLSQGQPPALRVNARPGQFLYLTGSVGATALAPPLFLGHPDAIQRAARSRALSHAARRTVVQHLCKPPRIAAAPALARFLSSTNSQGPCITDISDGVLREAWRVARAAQVEIELDAEAIPAFPPSSELLDQLPRRHRAECLLSSGEEWELLFTSDFSPDKLTEGLTTAGPSTHPIPIARIGRITRTHPQGNVRTTWYGTPIEVDDLTFKHFEPGS